MRFFGAARGAGGAGIRQGFTLSVPLCERDCLALLTARWGPLTRSAAAPLHSDKTGQPDDEARYACPPCRSAAQRQRGAPPDAGSALSRPARLTSTVGAHAAGMSLTHRMHGHGTTGLWDCGITAKRIVQGLTRGHTRSSDRGMPRSRAKKDEAEDGGRFCWRRGPQRQAWRAQHASLTDSLGLFDRSG